MSRDEVGVRVALPPLIWLSQRVGSPHHPAPSHYAPAYPTEAPAPPLLAHTPAYLDVHGGEGAGEAQQATLHHGGGGTLQWAGHMAERVHCALMAVTGVVVAGSGHGHMCACAA